MQKGPRIFIQYTVYPKPILGMKAPTLFRGRVKRDRVAGGASRDCPRGGPQSCVHFACIRLGNELCIRVLHAFSTGSLTAL